MAHYRTLYSRSFLAACDLFDKDMKPRDWTLTIAKVEGGELRSPETMKKRRAPVVTLQGADKKLVCNATNGATIAKLYGTDTSAWVGKRITLYPTKARFGRYEVDAIRVRPTVPNAKTVSAALPAQPPPEIVGIVDSREPGYGMTPVASSHAPAPSDEPQDPPEWDNEPEKEAAK